MKKKMKASKAVKQVIKDVVHLQLTWVPSVSDEVASQRVVMAPVGKPTSEWTYLDVAAGEGEATLSLIKGVKYSIYVVSTTAEGQKSASDPIEYVVGSGIPMPATDLALVTVPTVPGKASLPTFPHEPKSKTLQGDEKDEEEATPEEPLSLEQGLEALEQLNKGDAQ